MKKSIRLVSKFAFTFAAAIALSATALIALGGSVTEARAECPCQTSSVAAEKGSIPQAAQEQAESAKKKSAAAAIAADGERK